MLATGTRFSEPDDVSNLERKNHKERVTATLGIWSQASSLSGNRWAAGNALFGETQMALKAICLWPTFVLASLAVAMALCIGVVDWFTGQQIILSTIYLLPIALMAWTRGLRSGLAISMLDVAIMVVLGILHGDQPWWAIAINASIRLCLFTFVSFLTATIRRQLELLERQSLTDALTGLANRRVLEERLTFELAKLSRDRQPLALLYFDVDHFKQLNDSQGHMAGDGVLRAIGATLSDRLRRTDLAVRMGGDEFLVILPSTDGKSAEAFGVDLRERLLAATRRIDSPVTFSIGACVFVRAPDSVASLIREVDRVMYSAKRSGRDAVFAEQWPKPEDEQRG